MISPIASKSRVKMPTPTKDPALADHLAWLGYVQPEGLVVSAPALVDAQAIIDRAQLGDLQRRLLEYVSDLPVAESDTADTQPGINNLPRLFTEFLAWQPELIHGLDSTQPLPPELTVSLTEFGEVLAPKLAVLRNDPVALGPGDRETAGHGDLETGAGGQSTDLT